MNNKLYDVDEFDGELSRLSSSNLISVLSPHIHKPTTPGQEVTEGKPSFFKLKIESPHDTTRTREENEVIYVGLLQALHLRKKWSIVSKNNYSKSTGIKDVLKDYKFKMSKGIIRVYKTQEDLESNMAIYEPRSYEEYSNDMEILLKISSQGPTRSHCYQRLRYLEACFQLHCQLNLQEEIAAQKKVPHRDFYNVRKVDTHVHHSSSMNQKHLLRFIKRKLKEEPQEIVIFRDGKYLTLAQVFESLNLTAYDLSVDTLDVHADSATFQRFDRFNLKYNPCGQSRLREIFLKTDNHIKGRYLAEITKELMQDMQNLKYSSAEYRLSVYGRDKNEWEKLAAWICDNDLESDNVRWLVQVPRLYHVYKEQKFPGVNTFEKFLENIFAPLFEATLRPLEFPKLTRFLSRVVGFDSVDDESKFETGLKNVTPDQWDTKRSPPYSYYNFFFFANLYTLNKLREDNGMNPLWLRPHCGEAGDLSHLASSYLLAKHINHGITLRKAPVLNYLFYLNQIGLAMSPLSNNSLFLDYQKNPFPSFFARGMNVSLSTDDPLQFHITREPLMEEYSIASSIYKLSPVDMCEIARNSVLQSGFEHEKKVEFLGEGYFLPSYLGNDIRKTNVPNIRICYRNETRANEVLEIYHNITNILQSTTSKMSSLTTSGELDGFQEATLSDLTPLTELLRECDHHFDA
eukprot:TRINITY_DN3522_c0_g1_i1.p1 TRINITY_DN3522_c0_g1~~TRINITY_DN3522_c0_g1_i1.p1  ORF type:complete len:743 (+),score=162.42 TRINITY_DN3522_c0_g1_i1:171-2231(+)